MVKRKTQAKRLVRKLTEIRDEMQRRLHAPVREQHRWLRQVLNGHYQYFGVIFNYRSLRLFKDCVVNQWRKALGQRSQKGRMTWAAYRQLLTAFPLPGTWRLRIRSSRGRVVAYGVRLLVSGDFGCFTRPEMKVERVSYDVMTPSAARGILEAIYWKPAILWVIEAIDVLKPIRFQSVRRNEVGHKAPAASIRRAMNSGDIGDLALIVEDERQQRAATVLVDVAYVIRARFELTAKAGPDDNEGKHLELVQPPRAQGAMFPSAMPGDARIPREVWPDRVGERPR